PIKLPLCISNTTSLYALIVMLGLPRLGTDDVLTLIGKLSM
ncbi:13010_t:CDS:1, partial [Cetraspora pellucida]